MCIRDSIYLKKDQKGLLVSLMNDDSKYVFYFTILGAPSFCQNYLAFCFIDCKLYSKVSNVFQITENVINCFVKHTYITHSTASCSKHF